MPELDLEVDRVATGGAMIGPGPDGRLVFVSGALPGERVLAEVTAEHKTRLEAVTVGVTEPSPDRREAPCRHVEAGCGGCDWQHASPAAQSRLRADIVADCLRRLAGLGDVDLRSGPALAAERYRTTVRAAVVEGGVGFRAARSHDVVPVESCLVAHPLVDEVLIESSFGSATEVTVRAGVRTGERLVVVTPTAEGVRVPDGVVVVGSDELAAGATAHYHEQIHGRTLRISAQSFFQCRPDGAEALVDAVAEALGGGGDHLDGGVLVDAYCGVGLFGAVGGGGKWERIVGVESNRSAAADAGVNYPPSAEVVRCRMERWRPEPAAAVVADPARSGLGRAAAARVAATEAGVVALVSCDPAALARDANLLAGHGFELDHVTVVDLFGHTSHVETVSRFVRT